MHKELHRAAQAVHAEVQFKSLHSQCPTTIDGSLLSARGQTLDTQDGRQTAGGSVSAPSKVKGSTELLF